MEAGKQPPLLILIYCDLMLEAVVHAHLRKSKTTVSIKFYVVVHIYAYGLWLLPLS